MTDTTEQVSSPAEARPSMADVKIETNSAPVEQQSTETTPEQTAQPAAPEASPKEAQPEAPKQTAQEPAKPAAEAPAPDQDSAKRILEAEIRAAKAESKLKELSPDKPLGDRPKIADYASIEDYDKAVDEWHQKKMDAEIGGRLTAAEQQKAQDAIRQAVEAKQIASRAKHSDYDAIVGPIVPIISNMPILKDFIAKNPMGTEVVYELGKNPAMLEQLMRQDVWDAGEALINMANRLKKPVTVTPTQAPEPIKPVGTNETVKPKKAAMNTADYIATRRAEDLKARRLN